MNCVGRWLEEVGLGQYATVFAENDVDFEVLPELSDDELKELGLSLGHRKKLLRAIAALSEGTGRTDDATGPATKDSPATPSPTPSEAERRQLTVMFCDLVGSTALSERLDPEDLREVLRTYREACHAVVDRFEGHIANYIGDGLLVYFGYPQAHEDDAARAVHAALAIVDEIGGLGQRLDGIDDVELGVRVGIHTGLVVAGDIGSGEAREREGIVGETPNIAARIEDLAESNTVVISEATQRLVEGLFLCDDLGPQGLKGVSEPVTAYRVREESGAPGRFEATHTQTMTALVGREEEIGLLLKRWEQAKDGEGQVVLLSGEAGIGKSRILRGFRDRLESQAHSRVLYYGSPYHSNSAFYPVIDQLERGLRFQKDDEPEQKLDKLETVLGNLDLSVAEFAPLFASFLSLPSEHRYSPMPLSPDELKNRTLTASVDFIVQMATQQSVLVVVEDAHWIDPSTFELLSLLIERLRTARILLLIAFRPELVPPWLDHSHVTALTLNRISRRESAEIITKVAGDKVLPEVILHEIVERADGVPIFIEELTKTVLESELLEEAEDGYVLTGPLPPLAIPASLQDSLMARLDRLAPVRDVAQLAAAIGRTFDYELLASVSPLDEDALDEALSQLVEAELIFRRGLAPQATYEFKHTLIRDTAYQSLLKSIRQQYHQRIGRALEERFPVTAESEPELLARHYTEAGLVEEAVDYWLKAGQRAAGQCANSEALGHLTKGLELLAETEDSPERRRRELALLIAIGVPLRLTKGVSSKEVGEAYTRARVLCAELGKPAELFAALWGLWAFHRGRSDFRRTRRLAEEILDLAQGENDFGLLLQAHHVQWTTLLYLGDWSRGLEHAEHGAGLYKADEHHVMTAVYGGHDAGVCALGLGAMFLWLLGRADEAMEKSEAAVDLARRLPHTGSRVHALEFASVLRQFKREPDAVLKYSEEVQTIAEEAGIARHVATSKLLRAWVLAAEGPADRTLRLVEDALSVLRTTGFALPAPYFLAVAAEACEMGGRPDEGLDLVTEGLRIVDETGIGFWEPDLHRLSGDLHLADGSRLDEAEAAYQRAIDAARRQGAQPLELRAATRLARLWSEQGKRDEARDLLQPIFGHFTEGFDTPDLKDAKALLDELV